MFLLSYYYFFHRPVVLVFTKVNHVCKSDKKLFHHNSKINNQQKKQRPKQNWKMQCHINWWFYFCWCLRVLYWPLLYNSHIFYSIFSQYPESIYQYILIHVPIYSESDISPFWRIGNVWHRVTIDTGWMVGQFLIKCRLLKSA